PPQYHTPDCVPISPASFIPLAEETGLIIPLGEWVLRKACAEAITWPLPIKVAVNLSPVQFKSRNLVQAVLTALAYSRLPPERLELEIT
ncbi:EAL domain-containing protein, partial [Enterococcus faecalis]|uniref:EAL domain-containing protein n=1 Tax=Enterococcus faecalis TaxID=1351 RepID=UPI003D6C594B